MTDRLTDVALCYHGWLRVGTGLSLLEGMIELDKRAEEINVRKSVGRLHQPARQDLDTKLTLSIAIRLVHGSHDRATSHHGTLRLFNRLPNEDKEIEIYEGYEHGELALQSIRDSRS
jgi:alpha-beta hydrolase superfamily lysophospholipase